MANTRLDRLFTLLDTGSNTATRKAAAQQIGEIQKLYPHELQNLLKRLRNYLRSKKWETRVAAGQAIEAIAANVPVWLPAGDSEGNEKGTSWTPPAELMSFDSFDIKKVLANGKHLLASGGEEFDLNLDEMSAQERLKFQRQQLKQRIGMAFDDDLISNEDLLDVEGEVSHREEVSEAVAEAPQAVDSTAGMTARQRNVAKRKARMLAKQQQSKPKSAPGRNSKGQPAPKKARTTKTVVTEQPQSSNKIVIEAVVDTSKTFDDDQVWPFQSFCDDLCHDLFHPVWEVRHGAGIGLREIFRLQGGGAGKTVDCPERQRAYQNRRYLEDYAIRLLCVFALDRFGDYVSDQVVAPVRETCAQTLGALLKHMEAEDVIKVLHVILSLVECEQWQIRHAGMLALKYLIAVRQNLVDIILPFSFPAILKGLQDLDDDVRSIAASCLLPIARSLVSRNPECLPEVLSILWDILLDLDDLSASTSSVMSLLAEFYSFPSIPAPAMEVSTKGGGILATLVPRLWQFFRHNIAVVRLAALSTLQRLLEGGADVQSWLPYVLGDALKYVYNNIVVEERADIRQASHEVWALLLTKVKPEALRTAASRNVPSWFSMAANPPGAPQNSSHLMAGTQANNNNNNSAQPRGEFGNQSSMQDVDATTKGKKKRGRPPAKATTAPPEKKHQGSVEAVAQPRVVAEDQEAKVLNIVLRVSGCKALGALARAYPVGNITDLLNVVSTYLGSSWGIQKFVASWVLTEWVDCPTQVLPQLSPDISEKLFQILLSPERQYMEIESIREKLRNECQVLVNSLISVGIPPTALSIPNLDKSISIQTALDLVTSVYEGLQSIPTFQQLFKSVKDQLEARRKRINVTVEHLQRENRILDIRVVASVVSSLVSWRALPEDIAPIVQGLLQGVTGEENEILQRRSADAISRLLVLCLSLEQGNLHEILLNHLRQYLCSLRPPSLWKEEGAEEQPETKQHKTTKKGKGKKGKEKEKEKEKEKDDKMQLDNGVEKMAADGNSEQRTALAVQNRGARFAFESIVKNLGEKLFQALPWLWDAIMVPLVSASKTDPIEHDSALITSVMDALQLLTTVVSVLPQSLYPKIMEEVQPLVFQLVPHPDDGVRTLVAGCIATMCAKITQPGMEAVIKYLLPMLSDPERVASRLGATESLHHVIEKLGIDILPYIVFLIVPILGRMSDQNQNVRKVVTYCFATLVRLMPLEAGVPNPPGLSQELVEQKQRERRFLEQLLDGSKLDTYALPIPINADLRKYQQDGVNWLAFLNKYSLHGILCDDMGLGKTLQSICMMASADHYRREQFKQTRSPQFAPLPSLVICPPTLTGHWYHEILKFCEGTLKPVLYIGKPEERKKKRNSLSEYNVVISSYDILRNDIDDLKDITFNYCILDEGHIIRNSKAKITLAVKMVKANHRLILSGTPIQNNVLELWSLFDFLMPGFLGSEKQFQQTYAKPILATRDPKVNLSEKEQEAGVLALEALHRQVLPFLLRRLKEDVLQDLPPKIIQDYYVELSSLQVQLYEDFARTQAKHGVEEAILGEEEQTAKAGKDGGKGTHIFQALQYLKRLCSHPLLVLNTSHPEYNQVMKEHGSTLHSVKVCPKLLALKQLLNECGIGNDKKAGEDEDITGQVVSNHRVLVFAQFKSMLDIVEADLFQAELPSVSYLRLDGSVPSNQRHGIVSKFNSDPTIDVLLLTTHVGGLGLNLTGADTVVFLEHDWNPMKDLQAMDRAHRIGQKKTVNVYRLITKGTLEEKIMGLQKFKLNIANSVITKENSSIHTMDTNQLLDLFDYSASKQGQQTAGREEEEGVDSMGRVAGGKGKPSSRQVIEELEELWDEAQYEEEYNLNAFIEKMN